MDNIPLTGKEIIKTISNMFKDVEFGFDVFALMKDKENTIKKIVFFEDLKNEDSFKDKIQNAIMKTIKTEYFVEDDLYIEVENIANDQNRIYIIPQDKTYNPLECLNTAEESNETFCEKDYDDVDALLFRFRRGTTVIWAYQYVNPILIPNKKKENFLVRAISTEKSQKFIEMREKIFTITQKIKLLVIDDNIITRDINFMQRHYGFERYIRMQAERVVNEIEKIEIVNNSNMLSKYIERTKKSYSKKMMRLKQYNVINMTRKELIMKIHTVERWENTFDIKDGKINLRNYKDVESLIDFFDERYTVSLVTNDEFDTDVKKLLKN